MTDQNPITRALVSVIMHSTEPMVVTDPHAPDHPMIAVNQAFETVTGYNAAYSVGRNCRFLQGAETDPATPRRIGAAIAAERGCVEWIVNYRRDGTVFWNLLFLSPVFSSDGTLLHYFGNQRDITNGQPSSLPDYTLGRADMPAQGEMEFHALLLGLLDSHVDGETSARALESLIDAARQLDRVTTRLTPAEWEPPSRK